MRSTRLRLPPLAALQAFEAAARLSSFKAAAAELSVTPTAISHHVSHLEVHLGVRLMERTPRSVSLTPAGTELFAATTVGFQEIRQAVRRLRKGQHMASLTISTTPAFLGLWLVPRLPQLRALLPGLDLRLQASDLPGTLAEGAIDVAIRYTDRPPPGADATLLQHDELTPVCSPQLRLRQFRDLQKVTLLHVEGQRTPRRAPTWSRWCAQAGVQDVHVDSGPRFSSSLHAVQAALAGQGVVLASPLLVADALTSGLLVRPFREALPGSAYHFLCQPALAAHPDITALRDWFVRSVAGSAARAPPSPP